MFSVIFEVNPRSDQWDGYLGNAKMLKPELEKIDGFIDNIRYGSLTREGWILSLSGWRDEKSLVRWRTKAMHHNVQEEGRGGILADYHLRVGEIYADTQVPAGQAIVNHRLDETQTGDGTTVTLLSAMFPKETGKRTSAKDVAAMLGFPVDEAGLVEWDVYDAVLSPGDMILMLVWKDRAAADAFEHRASLPAGVRMRHVRVVRDYAKYDRREAPQYYPDAPGRETIHG